MTDARVTADLGHDVELECAALPGGKFHLSAQHAGEAVHSAEFSSKPFGSATLKGQFANRLTEALEDREGVDAEAVEAELRRWFAEMHETDKEDTALLPQQIVDVLEGTESVEIYGGDPTTVHVSLTWKGQTRELEFTADEMTSGGEALVSQMANKFYEFGFECGSDEWDAVVEKWEDQAEVRSVVETAEETVAGRILEYITHGVVPVIDKEKLANGPEAAWVDLSNAAAANVADPDAPIVWVEKTFLLDQLDRAGKPTGYLSQLVKTLNQQGDLYGVPSEPRQRWPNSQGKERAGYYPFRPAAVGVDVDDLEEPGEESATEEVPP